MKRGHALLIALLIGAATLAGLVAATRTAGLGHASQQTKVPPAAIAARMHALDRTEAKLRRILTQKPAGRPVAPAAAAQRVVYVRPAPHVVTIHRAHGGEHEAEGSGHDGGGFDD